MLSKVCTPCMFKFDETVRGSRSNKSSDSQPLCNKHTLFCLEESSGVLQNFASPKLHAKLENFKETYKIQKKVEKHCI